MTKVIGISSILVIGALLLAAVGGVAPRLAEEIQLDQALDGIFQFTQEDLSKMQRTIHAETRCNGGEACEAVKNCSIDKLRLYKGINLYTGYWMMTCLMETGRIAVVIVWQWCKDDYKCTIVTNFFARNFAYVRNCIEKGKYCIWD